MTTSYLVIGCLVFLILTTNANAKVQKGKQMHGHIQEHSEEKISEEEAHQLYQDSMMLPPGFWIQPGSHFTHDKQPEGNCQDLREELFEQQSRLIHVKDTLLDGIECGDGNCTKIVLLSSGHSAVRHPPRFGLYNLNTMYEGYPVYSRAASGQSLFYKKDYDKWEYAHRIERWIVGPTIGDATGGIVFLSDKKCPWKIPLKETEIYYYDKKVKNIWNPKGNGWRLESSEKVSLECYNADKFPAFECGCHTINLTSVEGGRIAQYHPQKIGLYHIEQSANKLGFLSPVFKKEGSNQFLYSHHPKGLIWLVGQTYTTWSMRLNLLKLEEEELDSTPFCPFEASPKGTVWEYLQSRSGEDEIWLKDEQFKIKCIR